MTATPPTLERLRTILSFSGDRVGKARRIAAAIRGAGGFRWVGIYDVTPAEITVIAWSGPGPPEFPRFPAGQGLCGAAVASRSTVVIPDVSKDSRYLTTLGSTRSEIVVPVLDSDHAAVRGLIDVESERVNAFGAGEARRLEECAAALRPLWEQRADGG